MWVIVLVAITGFRGVYDFGVLGPLGKAYPITHVRPSAPELKEGIYRIFPVSTPAKNGTAAQPFRPGGSRCAHPKVGNLQKNAEIRFMEIRV